MTVQVVERKSVDRVGKFGTMGEPITRWCVEQDEGRVLRREWFDNKEEAEAARRELVAPIDRSTGVRRSAWELP